MKNCRIVNLGSAVSILLALNCVASDPVELADDLKAHVLVKFVHPEYPLEAKRAGQTGSGVFILNVNPKTGEVTSVKVAKRTGSRLLDIASLKAFIEWKFKPNTVVKVRIPITFAMSRGFPPSAHPTPFGRPVTPFN